MSSEHLYRILLKAYPRRYRHEYEEAMAQCFRDQLRAANTARKRLWLWARTISDFALTVIARHLECGSGRDRRLVPLRGRHHGTPPGFTESAIRSIYFARLKAASYSSTEISLEDLLLGTLQNDPDLGTAVLGTSGVEAIGRAIAASQASPSEQVRKRKCKIAKQKAAEIPLSMDCKRVLAQAFWQAHGSGDQVGSRHILAAMLDHGRAGRLLRARALDLSPLRRRGQ